MEYGIFTDEGLLEADFWSDEEAGKRLDSEYPNDGAWVAPVCREHPEQEERNCEECNAEEE